MARHLEAMAKWSDLAHEIIVVDSRSSDGTLELIQAKLRHPRLRIIVRDRGLYESWNEGIAATTGDWIYISTAGDTIEREHLVHLRDLGERAEADVVISAPSFVDEVEILNEELSGGPGREFNILPAIWNARVTSHVALSDVARMITREAVLDAL
ncbi:MAG: glycosyltransferase, partial [Verrucomicrobia bacterium]|nr:glycosyltransferase [Verrucomicrobiota bacterium]